VQLVLKERDVLIEEDLIQDGILPSEEGHRYLMCRRWLEALLLSDADEV
jgi:hypothetical protein